MNRHQLFQPIICFGLIIIFLVGCSTFPPAAAGGKIEGTITLEGNINEPLANVTVTLNRDFFGPDAGEEIATTTTDSDGKYAFEGVSPGDYVVSAAVQDECLVLDLMGTITVETGSTITKDLSLPCAP